jgi:hypothetical protein
VIANIARKSLSVGEWLPALQKVQVTTPKVLYLYAQCQRNSLSQGPHFSQCGYFDRDRAALMLYPEEALFLVDKVYSRCLDLNWTPV